MNAWYGAAAQIAWHVGLTSWLNRLARHVRSARGRYSRREATGAESYQVLMYHRVHPSVDPFSGFSVDTVHPDDFEDQVVFLRRHYRVLPLRELWRRVLDRTLPPNAVAITFDDGYADNYHVALPILRRHGVPATLFLASSAPEEGEPLWYDRVLHAFRMTRRERLDFPPFALQDESLETLARRRVLAERCLGALRALPEAERRTRQDELFAALRVDDFSGLRGLMMTWEQARALERGDFAVEAHTVTHPIMSRLAPDVARAEAVTCKRAIEERLQKDVRFFAYPNGKRPDFTEETKAVLRASGYACAFSTVPTKNGLEDDPYALGRATPWFHDIARFALLQARINLAR